MKKPAPIYYWGPLPEELGRDSWGVEYIYVSRDMDRCLKLAKTVKTAKVYRIKFVEVRAERKRIKK